MSEQDKPSTDNQRDVMDIIRDRIREHYKIEMVGCEMVLMDEIGDKHFKRRQVAQSYRFAMDSSERDSINWARVNQAIISRWSVSGLEWIKKQAHSGRCFNEENV